MHDVCVCARCVCSTMFFSLVDVSVAQCVCSTIVLDGLGTGCAATVWYVCLVDAYIDIDIVIYMYMI